MVKRARRINGPLENQTVKWFAPTENASMSQVPETKQLQTLTETLCEYKCYELWRHLNRENFGGALKVWPKFRMNKMKEAYAYFHPDFPKKGECLIEVSISLSDDIYAKELESTILHEMCHQMQFEKGLPMGHNESFEEFAKAARLNENH
jgi:hypothetical protein